MYRGREQGGVGSGRRWESILKKQRRPKKLKSLYCATGKARRDSTAGKQSTFPSSAAQNRTKRDTNRHQSSPYPSDGPKLRRWAAVLCGHRHTKDELGQKARAHLSTREGRAQDEQVQVRRLVRVLRLHLDPPRVVPALVPNLTKTHAKQNVAQQVHACVQHEGYISTRAKHV